MTPLISRRAAALSGSVRVPGDKSISHRALMLGALAVGETRIEGLLTGADVLATAAAMTALGVEVADLGGGAGGGTWRTRGVGIGGLAEPDRVLDMGNSGTAARLLLGVLAGHSFTAFLTGDHSLCARPMQRVMGPLAEMGARFTARGGGRLPLAVSGTADPLPIVYEMPVASAQVKSAVLLAGLHAPGRTTVIEPAPTRDHTELMLRHFGAEVKVEDLPDGRRVVSVAGQPELAAAPVTVPADPSSAAFPAVAALLVEGSDILIPGVGVNPLRTGLFETLREMGGDIAFDNRRVAAGEPVADLRVRASRLRGVEVPAGRAPSMIDEYPILAAAAACAEGTTVMHGLSELRVKESDRLAAIAAGLEACGVRVEAGHDNLTVHGTGRPPQGGATVVTHFDHRIAMAFLILGGASAQPIRVDDGRAIDTSFPGFAALMNGIGMGIEPNGDDTP